MLPLVSAATSREDASPPSFLRLAGHSVRWRLLSELARSDRRAGELCARLELPQNLVSYHLGRLRAERVVSRRRSSGLSGDRLIDGGSLSRPCRIIAAKRRTSRALTLATETWPDRTACCIAARNTHYPHSQPALWRLQRYAIKLDVPCRGIVRAP